MNIAVIAHTHFPIVEPFAGGLETHTHLMVKQLVDEGHEVTVYAKHGTQLPATVVPIFFGNAKGGANPRIDIGYGYAMGRIRAGDFDLIINNSLSWIPLRNHTESMVPMITIFHTPPLHEMVDELKQEQPINRSFIAVSELTAKSWQKQTGLSVNVVPNGLDIAQWDYSIIQRESPAALWFGRITPEKGTHIAIQACKELGLPLKLVGHIYDEQYFSEKIKPNLTNTITYEGHKNQKEVNQLLMDASVALVTPLWDEPFGFVAIEAMVSGTPVAALPNGAMPYIVHSTVGSLAIRSDLSAFKEAIRDALRVNRANCRKYIENTYSLKHMVEGYFTHVPQPEIKLEPANLWQTYP